MIILILNNSDLGLYKTRKELIQQLLMTNEVYISVPRGSFVDKFVEMGCHYIETTIDRHGTNPITDYKLLRFYTKIIKEIKPDRVLTYSIKPNIYGGLACKKKGVQYIENITGLGTAVENPGLLQKITLFLYRKALKKAKMVFFQNSENRDFMVSKKVLKGKYDLIPGSGVNLEDYKVADYPNDKTINFLFIARIMKEKGIDQYLDAAKYITQKYPNCVFHVYGAYEQDYEGIIKELDQKHVICYHGQVADMKPVYAMSSCTIHPSYYPEGMSNVLLESCATGRPIITTNRSGCREVVIDGVNGFLIEPKSSQSLIEAVERFVNLPIKNRREMGLNGRKHVESNFDRNIVITKYLEVIND